MPAQFFSGPSPLGLATILYCLTFETSLFVAFYDSQGHGGGIQPPVQQVTLTGKTSAQTVQKTSLPLLYPLVAVETCLFAAVV
jgi:hypothetical protein